MINIMRPCHSSGADDVDKVVRNALLSVLNAYTTFASDYPLMCPEIGKQQ